MGIIIAIVLFVIAVILFWAVQKKLITDKTLQRLANVAGVIAFIAALFMFIDFERKTNSVVPTPSSSPIDKSKIANKDSGVIQFPVVKDTNVSKEKETNKDPNSKLKNEDKGIRKTVYESPASVPSSTTSDELAKSIRMGKLIIDVSREIENADVYIDGQLKGKSPQCTVSESEGIHEVLVKYETKLNQQCEYSTNINIIADSTTTLLIRKNFFRLK